RSPRRLRGRSRSAVGRGRSCRPLVLLRVFSCRQQVSGRGRLYLEQPARTVRVGGDQARVVDDGRVDRGDGAGDRREQLGDGLGGFHLTAAFAGDDGGPDLGQVDKDQIAESRRG